VSRYYQLVLALLAAVILQVAVAPHITIAKVVPNFVLLVVIAVALLQGSRMGTVVGFSAGLIFDLIGTGPIGVAALVFCFVGYISGSLHENMFAEGWRLPVTVAFFASLFAEGMYVLALRLIGENVSVLSALIEVVIPSSIYNGLLAVVSYSLLARILRQDKRVTTFRRIGR